MCKFLPKVSHGAGGRIQMRGFTQLFTHNARASNVKTFLGRVNNGVFELTSINPSSPQSPGLALARASLIAMPTHGVL